MAEQFRRFRETGLPLDHVNGHLHLHLHPVVADILLEHAREWGIRGFRWSRDLFWLSWKLGRGPLFYRVSHAVIFNLLSLRVKKRLERLGLKHTRRVFGLMQTSHVEEPYLLKLLDHLPEGDSEVYSHPSTEPQYQAEYQALTAPAVIRKLKNSSVTPIRYSDL
ncbi:MAG: ChbG/HpnK family deacetylase [Verrucomicrobia bacterium]|nr:ChbG/HpnK family deacetylase [Verrucomicrobiota bacterium]